MIIIGVLALLLTIEPTTLLAAKDRSVHDGYSIAGVVWTDLNDNGLHEVHEPLAVGELVFVAPVVEDDFAQVLVLTTNTIGEFSASDLAPGQYRIWVITHKGDERETIVTISSERTVALVELPLVGFTLFMPQVSQ